MKGEQWLILLLATVVVPYTQGSLSGLVALAIFSVALTNCIAV